MKFVHRMLLTARLVGKFKCVFMWIKNLFDHNSHFPSSNPIWHVAKQHTVCITNKLLITNKLIKYCGISLHRFKRRHLCHGYLLCRSEEHWDVGIAGKLSLKNKPRGNTRQAVNVRLNLHLYIFFIVYSKQEHTCRRAYRHKVFI